MEEPDLLRQDRIENYDIYLNNVSKRRTKTPFPDPEANHIYVSTGYPNPKTFPIINGQFMMNDGTTLDISEPEMKATLQYGSIAGNQELRHWLIDLQYCLHSPPLLDGGNELNTTDLIMTTGCTEGIEKVLEAVMEEGDMLLTETFTYPCLFNLITPLGVKTVPVRSDDEGMLASALDNVLSTWNEQTSGRRPKVLYCIPSAANPTGVTWSMGRKKDIYNVARHYGLLILEDDPYYMMQFSRPRVPSFLSLDTDGRVIRLDTFSKILSAGIRLGFMTGPKQILERVKLHMEVSSVHGGNLAQIMILKVLQHMHYEGFMAHGDTVSDFYQERCEKALKLAKKHLTGLAEWRVPHGGIFLWLRMLGSSNSTEVIRKAHEKGATFTDGAFFMKEGKPCEYIRMSYSLIDDQDMETAVKILASVLREEGNQDGQENPENKDLHD